MGVRLGSRSSLIGLITLDVKCAGARSAGNPHATCDVAGAGNQLTVRIVRHWSSRQGCKSGKVKVPFPSITCIGRIAYPERAEVTKHDMPGRKSLGCPVGKLAAVGAIWETTQTQRPEHNEMSASSKTSPRKSRVRGSKREADP